MCKKYQKKKRKFKTPVYSFSWYFVSLLCSSYVETGPSSQLLTVYYVQLSYLTPSTSDNNLVFLQFKIRKEDDPVFLNQC